MSPRRHFAQIFQNRPVVGFRSFLSSSLLLSPALFLLIRPWELSGCFGPIWHRMITSLFRFWLKMGCAFIREHINGKSTEVTVLKEIVEKRQLPWVTLWDRFKERRPLKRHRQRVRCLKESSEFQQLSPHVFSAYQIVVHYLGPVALTSDYTHWL